MQHHKFKGENKRYRIELPRYKKMDVEMYLSKSYPMVKNKIKKALRKLKSIKIQLSLRVKLKKYRQTEDDFVYIKTVLYIGNKGNSSKVHIKRIISELNKEVAARLDKFLHHGSNWNLVKIYSLELKIVKYATILGGC